MSVVYALFVEMVVYREFGIKDLTEVCREAAVLSACLLFILSCAMTFIWLLTAEQIPTSWRTSSLNILTARGCFCSPSTCCF